MKYKYGNFPSRQFEEYKCKIRKDIFFLLLMGSFQVFTGCIVSIHSL